MISVRKLAKPGGDEKGTEHFLQRHQLPQEDQLQQKKYGAKKNKYRGNMEEAPCGLIIGATPQVPYSLTASAL